MEKEAASWLENKEIEELDGAMEERVGQWCKRLKNSCLMYIRSGGKTERSFPGLAWVEEVDLTLGLGEEGGEKFKGYSRVLMVSFKKKRDLLTQVPSVDKVCLAKGLTPIGNPWIGIPLFPIGALVFIDKRRQIPFEELSVDFTEQKFTAKKGKVEAMEASLDEMIKSQAAMGVLGDFFGKEVTPLSIDAFEKNRRRYERKVRV
jgi:hypothetical protein